MRTTMKEAYASYRRRLGWTRWEPGMLRDGRNGFYYLPRWMDNIEMLAVHLQRRARGLCLTCSMPGNVHKMDCYHSWTIRDDLRLIIAPLRRLIVLGPRRHP
jgi:hypothetical protein